MQKWMYLILINIGLSASAQTKVEKVNNNDLRGELIVTKITHFDKSKYEIKKTKQEEFSLNIYKNKKHLKLKISKDEFEAFDSEYVNKFIHMKYMSKRSDIKECKAFSSLHMRGENLKVCESNTKNIKIVENLIKKLNKKI